jgi:hypothetical protein
MARFFFHFTNGHAVGDVVETELANLEEVRAQSLHATATWIRDLPPEFWREPRLSLKVTDNDGKTVLALAFKGGAD